MNKIKVKYNTEENIRLFFEELNSELCDPEKLKNLSLQRIFLYEPLFRFENIKYHEYAIDISIMNNQFCIIYNEKQYERLWDLIDDYKNKYCILKTVKLIQYLMVQVLGRVHPMLVLMKYLLKIQRQYQ